MAHRTYNNPPITEAVMEVRFANRVPRNDLDKFCRKLKSRYPHLDQNFEVSVHLEVDKNNVPSGIAEPKFQSYRLRSESVEDLVIVAPDRLATARLAPYCGWDQFWEAASKNLRAMKDFLGVRPIVRVSTRYINRIDIPVNKAGGVELEDYVLIQPRVPDRVPSMGAFATNFSGPVPSIGGAVTVNAGNVDPVLIDHLSFLLDIDLWKASEMPQSDEELEGLFMALRDEKDAIFESFLTDKCRELFDRV